MIKTEEFRGDIHQIYNQLQKEQANGGQGIENRFMNLKSIIVNEDQKQNENINQSNKILLDSQLQIIQTTAPAVKPNKKPRNKPKNNNIALEYNELPTQNKLLPKIRVTDDQLDMLKINDKGTIFNSEKNRRLLKSSQKKRLRQQLNRRIKGIQDQAQQKSNPLLKSALQLGIGKNAKEVEKRIANLAINGYYYCHESNEVIKDKETPSKRKLQFITESEKINNIYKKQMENVVRDFDQGEFITNNNTEFDKSTIIGREVLPNQLKSMNDMKKPSVRGALLSKLREKNHLGEDLNVILKANKELRMRNREKNSKFFENDGNRQKDKGVEGEDEGDDDDDQDYNPDEDSEEENEQEENKGEEDQLIKDEEEEQKDKLKKNITIDDILKLEGEGDVITKQKLNTNDQRQQLIQETDDQEAELEENQQEELALGAENGGDYQEQASYFIKNQNIAQSETNGLKNLPSLQINNRIDTQFERIQVKQQKSTIQQSQLKQNQTQLSQKSTGQGNDQKAITSPLQLTVQEQMHVVSKKKKKKQNAQVNYFLQDQAQLGSDNQQHDNVCYGDNFGDDEYQQDDQEEQDLKDLIDNTNNINENDQIQLKNRMDLYIKNQQRDQELDNQKILDLVMGKKREEQSS